MARSEGKDLDLSKDLGLDYVCLDAEIIARAGKGIPEIVDQHSWEYFRDLEEQVVKDCAARDGQVLDTGGGVITRSSPLHPGRPSNMCFRKGIRPIGCGWYRTQAQRPRPHSPTIQQARDLWSRISAWTRAR